ncbi:PTS glucose transporter subunit IIA, partial [Lactobacillaceae bacterium KNUT 0156]|nr:PTS glucose transporter subunit IIA [Weissella cibaria]
AAAFAIFFLAKKDEKLRALSSSAGASAMLGITEPAMFGVNLKYKFPFFIALGSAGIAGLVIGLFHVLSSSLGPAGVIGFIAIPAAKWVGFFISIALAFVLAFSVTYGYGKRRHFGETGPRTDVPTRYEPAPDDIVVASPVAGRVDRLSAVDDPVFSSGAMGKGVAVLPTDGQVFAPINGTVTVVYPTGHAYGLLGDDGVEILIHIGVDT